MGWKTETRDKVGSVHFGAKVKTHDSTSEAPASRPTRCILFLHLDCILIFDGNDQYWRHTILYCTMNEIVHLKLTNKVNIHVWTHTDGHFHSLTHSPSPSFTCTQYNKSRKILIWWILSYYNKSWGLHSSTIIFVMIIFIMNYRIVWKWMNVKAKNPVIEKMPIFNHRWINKKLIG